MVHSKNILQLLLAIQICSIALALPYKHPDAEMINFGHHEPMPSMDEMLIASAIRRGMDGQAVAELLRTKQPVVKVTLEPNGATKTTTYSIDPNGSISSSTVIEKKTTRHYDAVPDSVPLDQVLKSPSGTVTRSYIDNDGTKVTQTYSVSKPRTTSVFDNGDNDDWFGGLSQPHHNPFPSSHWPVFSRPNYAQPFKPSTSFEDSDDWTVVEDNPNVETTTRQKFPSWTPTTWNLPEHPSVAVTTTARPLQPKPTTPLPSLEDFLKSQYGQNAPPTTSKSITTTSFPNTTTASSSTTKSTTPQQQKKPLGSDTSFNYAGTKHPIATEPQVNNMDPQFKETLRNAGIPLDEITKIDGDTITTEHQEPDGRKRYTIYKVRTSPTITTTYEHSLSKVPSITPTHNSQESPMVFNLAAPNANTGPVNKLPSTKAEDSSKPNINNLNPQIQEAIQNAGISPEDITNINDDTITTKRKEADGSIVTTMFKVPTTSTIASRPKLASHFDVPLESPKVFRLASFEPQVQPSPISIFLAQFGMTKSDILSKNGEYTRTIIDDDGQVLTATFILSSPIRGESDAVRQKKPVK